jgi:CubicO group peptidase (beta-lactamase class C family)
MTLLCFITGLRAQLSSGNARLNAAIVVGDSMFANFARQNHVPGLIYGLMVDGKLVHTFSQGVTDVTKKLPVNARSEFRIASMTKSFTALAVLRLRDEGKFSLDDPIGKYIPEMKGQKYLTADAPPVTIRQLLSHAAGLPEDNPWGDRQLAVSDADMMKMIGTGLSFSNSPGIAYEYSNLGFAILGHLIKVVTGESYETYINRNILLPLGMTHTYWEYSKVPPADFAHGYRWLNNNFVEQPLLLSGAYGAMGGMITSMEDFSKYVNLHMSAWPPTDEKEGGPVKRSSIREMHHLWNVNQLQPRFQFASGRICPTVFGYGYGLRISQDCDSRIMVGHSGGLPGFGSDWKILPDYGIGIISFGNLTYTPCTAINTQVIDTIIALAALKPKPVAVSPILEKRKSELFQLLPDWNNAARAGIFAENFFLDYFPDSLRKDAQKIFLRAGKVLGVRPLNALNNLRGSFVIEAEKKNIEVWFTLTPEAVPLIQEYRIRELDK